MGAALDIAAASGKNVDAVSAAIAKGYTGQTAALEKLIPGLSEAAKESDDFNVIMGELATKTGGAAAEIGRHRRRAIQDLSDPDGRAAGDARRRAPPGHRRAPPDAAVGSPSFAAENTGAIKILVGVVAALAAGILVANAAMKAYAAAQLVVKVATAAWTAAQWLLNAALDGEPDRARHRRDRRARRRPRHRLPKDRRRSATSSPPRWTPSRSPRTRVDGAFDVAPRRRDARPSTGSSATGSSASSRSGRSASRSACSIDNFDAVKAAGDGAFDAIKARDRRRRRRDRDAVIGAVERLIGALGRIRSRISTCPGRSLAPAPAARVGARAGPGSSASSPAIVVNVYGAIDPEGTARTIERVLRAPRPPARTALDVGRRASSSTASSSSSTTSSPTSSIRHGRADARRRPDRLHAATDRCSEVDRGFSSGFRVGVPLVVDADGAPRFTGTVTDAALDDDELTRHRRRPARDPLPLLGRRRRLAGGGLESPRRARLRRGRPRELLLLRVRRRTSTPSSWRATPATRSTSTATSASSPRRRRRDRRHPGRPHPRPGALERAHRLEPSSPGTPYRRLARLERGRPGLLLGGGDDAAARSTPRRRRPCLTVDPADVAYVPVWEMVDAVENVTTVGYGDRPRASPSTSRPRSRSTASGPAASTRRSPASPTPRGARPSASAGAPSPAGSSPASLASRGYPLRVGQVVELSELPAELARSRPGGRCSRAGRTRSPATSGRCELAVSDPLLSGVVLLWATTPAELAWNEVDPATSWNEATSLDALTPP